MKSQKNFFGFGPIFLMILCAAIIAAGAIIIGIGSLYTGPEISLSTGELRAFNTGWVLCEEERETPLSELPETVSATSGAFTLTNRLPEELLEGDVLYFDTFYTFVTVFIEDRQIYEYRLSEQHKNLGSYGMNWNVVPLSTADAGKEIRMEFSQTRGSSVASLHPVSLGSDAAVLQALLRQNTGNLLFVGLLLVLAAGILVFLGYSFAAKMRFNRFPIVYLGISAFLAAVWVAADRHLLQFITSNPSLICLSGFFSFLLMPLPIVLFAGEVLKKHKRVFRAIAMIFFVNGCIQSLIYLLTPVGLALSIYSTHVLVVLSVILFFVFSFQDRRSIAANSRILLTSLILLCLFILICFVDFYFGGQARISTYFKIGVVLFVLTACYYLLQRGLNYINRVVAAKTYKQLAYFDSLAALSNRNAYDKVLEMLDDNPVPGETITILIADLDNFKKVNDQFGHSVGDEQIAQYAGVFRSVFEPFGMTFRIGGDEFAVLFRNVSDKTLRALLEELRREVEAFNAVHTRKISHSVGYATEMIGDPEDFNIYTLMNRADSRMYEDKIFHHDVTR